MAFHHPRTPREHSMAKPNRTPANDTTPLVHGAATLPSVMLDDYNNEAKDKKGFIGDAANKKTSASSWTTSESCSEFSEGIPSVTFRQRSSKRRK